MHLTGLVDPGILDSPLETLFLWCVLLFKDENREVDSKGHYLISLVRRFPGMVSWSPLFSHPLARPILSHPPTNMAAHGDAVDG
jgi:hypothetical protein